VPAAPPAYTPAPARRAATRLNQVLAFALDTMASFAMRRVPPRSARRRRSAPAAWRRGQPPRGDGPAAAGLPAPASWPEEGGPREAAGPPRLSLACPSILARGPAPVAAKESALPGHQPRLPQRGDSPVLTVTLKRREHSDGVEAGQDQDLDPGEGKGTGPALATRHLPRLRLVREGPRALARRGWIVISSRGQTTPARGAPPPP
jgi:hypothetical protein